MESNPFVHILLDMYMLSLEIDDGFRCLGCAHCDFFALVILSRVANRNWTLLMFVAFHVAFRMTVILEDIA